MKKTKIRIITIWQSLVVESYRSFFYEMSKNISKDEKVDWEIGLISPDKFIELGGQLKSCPEFKQPFSKNIKKIKSYILKSNTFHVQVVWFRALYQSLKSFFSHRQASDRNIVISMAEPYSVTSFLIWLNARVLLGKNFEFYCFALQNIYKRFPLPLMLVQKFIFLKSHGILSLGNEQTEVIQRHGYKGRCLDFPLWFNSDIFFPRNKKDSLDKLNKNQEKHDFTLNKKIIGFSGSLKKDKGVTDLFDCLEKNIEKLKNSCAVAVSGTGELQAYVVEKMLKLESLGLKTLYFGPLDADEMPLFLSLVDVLVVPSRTATHWKEQFGRIIIEGQACGNIVIGSDSGEIPVVIDDPSLIFQEKNIDDLFRVLNFSLGQISSESSDRVKNQNSKVFNKYSDKVLAAKFLQALQG